jgi:F0F1-type ATP synthase assembly protein I
MSDNKPDKRPNKWLALINIPFQMGIIIVAFSWLGKWLDGRYPNENEIWFIIFTMLGVGIALYNVVRQVNKLNN